MYDVHLTIMLESERQAEYRKRKKEDIKGRLPFKGSHHCCDAASVIVVIGDKSSSVALNSFQLSYVDVLMRVQTVAAYSS